MFATFALTACAPARGEPVGVSHNGTEGWARDAAAPVKAVPLAGLDPDFRTKLHSVGRIAKSEHLNGATAVLWADDAGQSALSRGSAAPESAIFVEELLGPSQADGGQTPIAVYLLTIDKTAVRFGVADGRGFAQLDDDAGTSLCARCHGESPRAPIWIARP